MEYYSTAVCNGSWEFGNNCKTCEKCLDTKPKYNSDPSESTEVPHTSSSEYFPAQQEWVCKLPIMQQSVLFAAVRAPDGICKNHLVKVLMRWYRRCILMSAFDRKVLTDPFEEGGGSFTGPFTRLHALEIYKASDNVTRNWEIYKQSFFDGFREIYLEHVDELPHHFQLHFMHAAEIVGYHHPDEKIRLWWNKFYLMIVNDAHLYPESKEEMNNRLSDNRDEWKKREVVTAR